MAQNNETPISAQVVVSPENASLVRDEFARAGFTPGPAIGTSFSIEGPTRLFNEYFHTQIGHPSGDVPLDKLPSQLRQRIKSVLFTPPPDFGPTNFQSSPPSPPP